MNLDDRINKVKNELKDKKIAIAFSGGADSSLLASLAVEVCDNPLAITFDNGLMPTDFIKNSTKSAEELGIKHKIIKMNMLDVEGFKKNNKNRCYVCREMMYAKIKEAANEEGIEIIVDGNNISDLLDDRPGILVTYQNNILSPLIKAGIESEEVIQYLDENNIKYSKATTCLATRINTDTKLSLKNINRINYSENLIKNITKSEVVKVRDKGDIAEIELNDLSLLNENKINLIANELKAVSFKKILLNITPKENKEELVVYKPCKDVEDKIMIEKELPYTININKTALELEKLGEVKCSENIGVAMLEVDGKNVTVFENGKIVARKVNDLEDAREILVKVLPLIRRNI
jgi:uncharacterized protein